MSPRTSRRELIALVLRALDTHGCAITNVAALCRLAGVSERTLRSAIIDAFGIGPSRYLRLRRLHLIRAALAVAECRYQSVESVVERFGLSDGGRMAREYRALFGEYPRDTLRRAINARW